MTKILFFRKTLLGTGSVKQSLILKSFVDYISNVTQKRLKDLLLNNWCLDIFNLAKTVFYPRIQMILFKELQV